MKRYKVLIICIFILCLYSCAPNVENYKDAVIYGRGGIEFYWGSDESESAQLFTEFSEFQAYMAPRLEGRTPEGFKERMNAYDEAWFEKNGIVVIHHDEASITPEISVRSVKYEGKTVRVILAKDVKGTVFADAYAQYFILVEIPESVEYTSAEYVVEEWNSGERKCLAIGITACITLIGLGGVLMFIRKKKH